MNQGEVCVVYFWMAVMLWDHAKTFADTATRPAPNVTWVIERLVAVVFYFKAFAIMLGWLAEWVKG